MSFEQRANIKFCVKIGKTFTETQQMMQKVYGDDALSRTQIYEWFNRFQTGRENIGDDEKSGRPKIIAQDNIEKVQDFIKIHKTASLRFAASKLGLSKDTIRRILTDELGLRKVDSVFVSNKLNDDQKMERLQYAKDLIDGTKNDANFLFSIVTGDVMCCESEMNHQNDAATAAESSSVEGSVAKKMHSQISNPKTVFICFYDSKGIIHKEFVPSEQTVTGKWYLEVLKRLMASVQRLRPEYEADNSKWHLALGENAMAAHQTVALKLYLTKNGIFTLNPPSSSPDLSGCSYFLFPKLHLALRGKQFNDINTIEKATDDILENIAQIEFKKSFESLLERANLCVEAAGDYFQ